MRVQAAFTLIEMMVVIAIIAILAVMGASLGSGWIYQAELNKANASLQSAINLARATAIRNCAGVIGNTTAASVSFENNKLTVLDNNCSNQNQATNTFDISAKITITDEQSHIFKEFGFNSVGEIIKKDDFDLSSPLIIKHSGLSEDAGEKYEF
ncbi:hypothetical protein GCM10023206_00890 [Acinetobacter puyangensis]|uniref:Prepilin-type N-terminal cleavage/methylation domain-containing protein n=1 Tax=Acinetobacter puyangensis TaxID=1096779 RepID=A0A240E7R5_9GAMM|nr:prepilin-type N-terminal cleavage/methylation domain-containing protein [Acinetobacter puyangensis]SNX44561.1 prepilin-type N-terminal cleavage/methylation domain-containing protein [Acinetobacter puyangensis]